MAIREQVLGPQHPSTQNSRNNLENLIAAIEPPPEGGA
jgi:hypothetical protein